MRKEQILETAFSEYSKYGVKRVSVDEIAQKLKISKKTIYEFFSGKDQLVLESFNYKVDIQNQVFKTIVNTYSSPLEIIIRSGIANFKFFYPISEAFIEDLKSNEILHEACEKGTEKVKAFITELIKKGIDEGELIQGENYEILGPIIKSQIMNNLNVEELKAKYTPIEICKFTLITIFKGVTTQKGRDVLIRMEKEIIK